MKLKLVKASRKYQKEILEMLEEWIQYNHDHPQANHSPTAIFKNDSTSGSK